MDETLDMNKPIAYSCDEEQDKPLTYTVPDGVYALTAWSLELRRSKNGDPLMNVKFGINGTRGDKWLHHYITLLPKSSRGHGITVHALKTLGFSVDKSIVNFKPSDIIGRVCRAELVTEKYASTNMKGDVVEKSKNSIKAMLYPLATDKPEMPVAKAEESQEVPF